MENVKKNIKLTVKKMPTSQYYISKSDKAYLR